MAGIAAVELHHTYPNGHVGLDNVSFTADDGEFLALVGPSGSGKTTLLRAIAGFLQPARGTLAIGDQAVAGDGAWVPPEKRHLGMVFQDHAIWPHWSVSRNIGYPLKLAGVPKRETAARVRAVLEKVGLPGLGDRNPAALSGGQRQRVALARAIVATPRALLLDEALSSLDEPLRARLRLELKSLTRDQGLTAIHVTHDRAEALALADRVVVLNQGKIEQIGTPQQLIREPASAFVAGFLSDATIFDATVLGAGGSASVHLPEVGEELAHDRLRVVGRPGLSGPAGRAGAEAAVMPADFRLRKLPSTSKDGAVITSSLYGLHGFDVSADWNGTQIRAHVRDWVPAMGDIVQPSIVLAHIFAAGDPRPAGAVTGQPAPATPSTVTA
ncbi:MAG: transporter ATP-binding protein [Pseudarthrobacter sp.]|nr:transporter ATP-binding protein [Pseudarthrobacter sp.]